VNTRERVQSSRFFFYQFQAEKKLEVGRVNSLLLFCVFTETLLLLFYIIPQFHFDFFFFSKKRGKPRRAARHEPFSFYITLEKRLWWNMGRRESAGAWNETLTCSIEFLKSRTAPSGSSNMKLFDGWSRVFRSNDSHHVLSPLTDHFFTSRLSMTNGQAQQ
jgi:hypothetical protein